MKNLNLRIVPLPTAVAEAARCAAGSGASDHAIVTADSPTGYPCRHCLRFAKPGERMVLFPFTSIPAGHPYSETGPIFVHLDACGHYEKADEYPAAFRDSRVFRAYNANFDMIEAEVPNGAAPEAVIEKLFQNPDTAFVQARSVTRGCYTFAIERT